MASAFVFRCLFLPAVQLSLTLYAILLILADLRFACFVACFGLVVAGIYLFKFAVPLNEKEQVNSFFAHGPAAPNKRPSSPQGSKLSDVFIIAHRTLALDAPENSLSGIRQAARNGIGAVEFDVQLSKDMVPVLFHDSMVDRVSECRGKVGDLTLSQLKELDISVHHLQHGNYKGEKVPTLEEAVAACLELKMKIFIDVKAPHFGMLSVLLKLFKRLPDLHQQSLVVCWSPWFLYQLRRADPSILTGLVWRPNMVSLHCPMGLLEHSSPNYREKWKHVLAMLGDSVIDWTYHKIVWYLCGAVAFLAHKDAINREYVRLWKQRGIQLLAWSVNDPLEKHYFANVLKLGYLTDTHVSHL